MPSQPKSNDHSSIEAMLVPAGCRPRKVRLAPDANGSFLHSMQECVEGPIETLPRIFDDGPVIYANEEGKLPWTDCKPNRAIYADDGQEPIEIIFGNMLCVGIDPEVGGLRSISAEECRKVRERFDSKDSIESADREIMEMAERNRRRRAG